LEGIKVGNKQIAISMLQFVNDTIFVAKANLNNIMTIKIILTCFESTS